MDQYSEATKATETALASQGSAYKENERYLDSYEAKVNQVKNAWTETALKMQEDFIGDALVTTTNIGTTFINMLTTMVDKVGLLPPIFGALSLAVIGLNRNFDAIGKGDRIWKFIRSIPSDIRDSGKAATTATVGLNLYDATINKVNSSVGRLKTLSKSVGKFLLGSALPVAGFMALGGAISWVIGKMAEQKERQEELRRARDHSIKSINTEKENIEDLVKEYDRLSDRGSKRDNTEESRYVELQNELAQILPTVKIGEDNKGNAIIANTSAVKRYVEQLEKQAEAERKQALDNAKSGIPTRLEEMRSLNEELAKEEKIYNDALKYQAMEDVDSSGWNHWQRIMDKSQENLDKLNDDLTNASNDYEKYVEAIISGNDKINKSDVEWVVGIAVEGEVDYDEIDGLIEDLSGRLSAVGENVDISGLNLDQFKLLSSIAEATSDSASVGAQEWENYGKTLELALGSADQAATIIGQLRYTEDDLAESARQAGVELSTHKPIFDDMGNTINWVTNEAYANAVANGEIEDSLEGIGDEVDELSQKYNETVSNIEGLNGVLDELSDGGELSAKSVGLIIEKYDEFLPYLDDEVKLRELIQDTIEDEGAVAEQVVKDKLMLSESYFQSEEVKNSNFYDWLGRVYEGDLSDFKNLAQAKDAVESKLISSLSRKWGEFYRINSEGLAELNSAQLQFNSTMHEVDGQAFGLTDWSAGKAQELNQDILNTNAGLKDMQAQFESISLGGTDFSDISANIKGAGSAAKKAGDAAKKAGKKGKKAGKDSKKGSKDVKESKFVADQYKASLEELELALAKIESRQKSQAKNSKSYRKSLKSEIDLLKQKKDLIESQNKALKEQIKSGYVQETGVVTSTKATGNSNQAKIWNFLTSKGFSDNVAAGIMGNLQLESNFNPGAVNHIGATGIAQWLGPRKRALQNFANARGTSIKDLQTQLDFMWKELNSTEKRTLDYLNANQNASAATIADQFDRLFERSERYSSHIAKRQKYANQALKKFGGTGGGGGTVADGSADIANSMQAVADAESTVISNQQEMLNIEDKIQDLYLEISMDKIDEYKRHGDMLDDQIAREEYYQGKVYETTSGYRARLREIVRLKRAQRDYMDDAIAFTEKEIKTNKNLNSAQKQQLKDTLKDLKVTRLDMMAEISQLNVEISQSLIDAVNKQYNEQIEELNYQFSRHEKILERTRQGTKKYSKTLKEQTDRLRENADLVFEQRQALRRVNRQNDLNYEQRKQIKDSMDELSLTYQDLKNQIHSVEWERMTNLINEHDSAIQKLTYSLERNQKILARLEEGSKEYIDLNDEIIRQTKIHAEMILAKRQAIMAEIKTLELSTQQHKELREELDNLSLEYQDLMTSIHDMEEEMKDSNEALADKIVETMKAAYEKQKEIALAQLDKEIEAAEKAHKKKMDMYDEDLKAYEKSINRKIDLIDKQHDKETYNKDVKKRNEEIAKIQRKIDELALDNSYAAQAERAKLEEELAEKKDELADFQNDRDVKLRKDNLKEQLDDYKEHIEKEKDVEDKSYKESKEARDKERKEIERHYDEIIKDERRWAKIHKSIVEGNVDETKKLMQEFLDDFGDMNADIAKEIEISWQEVLNMIDRVNDAMEDLDKVTTTPGNTTRERFEISSNSFATQEEAQRVADAMRKHYGAEDVRVSYENGEWKAYGHYDDKELAQKILDRMVEVGYVTGGQISRPTDKEDEESYQVKTMAYRTKEEADRLVKALTEYYGAENAHVKYEDGAWRAYGSFDDSKTAQKILDRLIELGYTDYGRVIGADETGSKQHSVETTGFSSRERAETIARRLERDYGAQNVGIISDGGKFKVKGYYDDAETAAKILNRMRELGYLTPESPSDSPIEDDSSMYRLKTNEFDNKEDADRAAKALREYYGAEAVRTQNLGKGKYQAVGTYDNKNTAEKILRRMKELNYIRSGSIEKFHDGGIVGSKGGKLSELVNKMFNAKPNEQVVKSLKGEIQIPPQNIANGFENMRGILKSMVIPQQPIADSGTVINHMDVRIDNLEGGEQGAKSMFKYIGKEMTKRGRGR